MVGAEEEYKGKELVMQEEVVMEEEGRQWE